MDMFEDGIRVQFHSSDDKLKLTPLKASLIVIDIMRPGPKGHGASRYAN